jgi:1-acyl-sn-glycerol-3-phosphate acyltransferase
MIKVLRVLYKIWFVLVFMIVGVIVYPFAWILLHTHLLKPLFVLQCWFWYPMLQLFLFLPYRTIRPKGFRFPKGPFVLISNHTSYLDILAMHGILRGRQFIFLGKESLKKFPIIGMFFKTGTMHVPINREDKSEASQSLRIMMERVDQGYIAIIFPEGTQSKKAPKMNSFKAGAFKLAIEKQVPIVSLTFLNHFKLLAQVNKLTGPSRPGMSRIIIHDVIETKGKTLEDLLDLQEQCYSRIESDLRNAYPKAFTNEHR